MTRSPAWHARIDVDGAVEGSGFLVADRTVLTCAHVMRYRDRAEVVFPGAPGAPDAGPIPARVVDRGAWAGGDRDRGDLAVLELDRPVDIAPAVFAALGAPYASSAPKLVAYGFPDGYGEEGVQSELRATSRQLISDEWAQLEFWRGYGQETDRGFSGAAVMLEGGGTVVGMVVAHDPVTRNGRMIPAQVLARHWAALADLVPTPGYPAEEKRRLRELVARCPALPGPLGPLVRAAAGPLGVEPPAVEPRSVWEAVWYLLSESTPGPGVLPLAELAVRLAGLAGSAGDERLARELRDWSRAHRSRHDASPPLTAPPVSEPSVPLVPPAAPSRAEHAPLAPPPLHARGRLAPAAPARRWSPILVEIRRSGADRGALLVEVSAYRDGSRRLVGQQRLAKREVRGWVLERIDDAFAEIDTEGRELIAFALPRGWLNQPVDQWTGRKSMSTPLGCVAPVVVMDHDRRASGRLQYRLKKAWDVLDRQPGSAVHRITCSGTVRPERLTVQLQDVAGPVGLTRPPKSPRDRALYGAVLDAPAPIVLWPRTGCPGGALCGASCQGEEFLNRLADQLSVLPPGELPERIFELRKRAFHHEGPDPHWAAELSFVWDDPRWFPDVARLSRSPVS
ncbi:trypsin-like peptidase domain-containing protein [Streptomyces sp. NPDC056244]|uniref:VMAP-C domain-containing protein n=1 Tax=Streptomyces sp. NPDC056244 TaxID=3345762 RepID=UPI0035D8FD86